MIKDDEPQPKPKKEEPANTPTRVFYRKEDTVVFLERFEPIANEPNHFKIKPANAQSKLIFQANLFTAKDMRKVLTIVYQWQRGKELRETYKINPGMALFTIQQVIDGHPLGQVFASVDEAAFRTYAAMMVECDTQKKERQRRIIQTLCKDHATASAHSPMISGCNVNNFAKSNQFKGVLLKVTLRHREPVANPYTSGNEREHFLLGRVTTTDCVSVEYLGTNTEPLGSPVPIDLT